MRKIDWEKTAQNIKMHFAGKAAAKSFDEILHISPRTAQAKFQSGRFNIEELYQIADIAGCSIDDLLVFEDDLFVPPEPEEITSSPSDKPDMEDSAAIKRYNDLIVQEHVHEEIRDLYEFLLYLPLIETKQLKDTLMAIMGGVSVPYRPYILKRLTGLYKAIPESPAKTYCDRYRDLVLRGKGNAELNFIRFYPEYLQQDNSYIQVLESFTGQNEQWSELLMSLAPQASEQCTPGE